MGKDINDYRDILKEELSVRTQANARYSLRAFARDLDLAPSRLSQILNGKQGLSLSRAVRLAEKIGFSPSESDYFVKLVQASDARSKMKRSEAVEAVLKHESKTVKFRRLDEIHFKAISDWYFYGVRELVKLPSFRGESSWIAKRLGISKFQAQDALKKLEALGLIRKTNNKYEVSRETPTTSHGLPSLAIRHFNKSLLKKAIKAIDLQTVNERNITTFTFALDPSEYDEFVKMIDEFRKRVIKKADSTPDTKKKDVYSLAIQFFRLTERGD